jgi:hypothetical protein
MVPRKRTSALSKTCPKNDLAHCDKRHHPIIITNQQTVTRCNLTRKLFRIHRAHAQFSGYDNPKVSNC